MITVRDLSKTFPSAAAPVLTNVTFELAQGALAAIVGPSGSGKSTLLRCLVGLEPFDHGLVKVHDTELRGTRDGDPRERARSLAAMRGDVGLVFQSYELFPHLTALQNCALAPIHVRGAQRDEAESRAHVLLERLGLHGKAGSFPEHLSGGQRQRVAIARALMMEPRVLFYDEPTAALDPSLKSEVAATLREIQRTGVTQVVVTHDIDVAEDVAQRVFELRDGTLA